MQQIKLIFKNEQTSNQVVVLTPLNQLFRSVLIKLTISFSDLTEKFPISSSIEELGFVDQQIILYSKYRDAIDITVSPSLLNLFIIRNLLQGDSVFSSFVNSRISNTKLDYKYLLSDLVTFIQPSFYCVTCECSFCSICSENIHSDHIQYLQNQICSCAFKTTPITQNASYDLFKTQSLIVVLIHFVFSVKNKTNDLKQNEIDFVLQTLKQNQFGRNLFSTILFSSKSSSIDQIVQNIGAEIRICDCLFYELEQNDYFGQMVGEIIGMCFNVRKALPEILSNNLNHIIGNNVYINMIHKIQDKNTNIGQSRLIEGLCTLLKIVENGHRDVVAAEKLIEYIFQQPETIFVEYLKYNPMCLNMLNDLLNWIARQNMLALQKQYENAEVFDYIIETSLNLYSKLNLKIYQWYLKGIQSINTPEHKQLLKNSIKSLISNILTDKFINDYPLDIDFYPGNMFLVPSIFYRSFDQQLSIEDCFKGVDMGFILFYILTPLVRHLIQFCMIGNQEVNPMNKIDWVDVSNVVFASVENRILIYEGFLSLRFFLSKFQNEVVNIINEQFDELNPSIISRFDFYVQLSYMPQIFNSEAFIKQAQTLDKISSVQQMNESIFNQLLNCQKCYDIMKLNIVDYEFVLDISGIDSKLQKQNQWVIPQNTNENNLEALFCIQCFEEIEPLCQYITQQYQDSKIQYSKALLAIRVLKQINTEIQFKGSFRHEELNIFQPELQENALQKITKSINISEKMKKLKRSADSELLPISQDEPTNDAQSYHSCSFCLLSLQEAVVPVNFYGEEYCNFCVHQMHRGCLNKLKRKVCPICEFRFTACISLDNQLETAKLAENILSRLSIVSQYDNSAYLVQLKLDQLQFLLKRQLILPQLVQCPKLQFPPDTFKLVKQINQFCPFCTNCIQCTQPLLFCLYCNKTRHFSCSNNCICSRQTDLLVNSLSIISQGVLIEPPYRNEFGNKIEGIFGDKQILNENEIIQCVFDCIFRNGVQQECFEDSDDDM
ncbi:Conserved_hypothetical protein [Hexamita inflata]|uniref:RING-type domain-containing protein n=1 Tax=Hexamita inflata TaxID=28002 RepID=A0AA86PDT7_9EUKA|nr:Conserved hypothetical protein [Hexamita inflata]